MYTMGEKEGEECCAEGIANIETLKARNKSQAIWYMSFNPSTWEAGNGGSKF